MSNEIKNISVALNKTIAEVKDVAKTEEGFGYKYASLDNILKMIRPILAKNGLALIQSQEIDREAGFIVVKTLLTHTSGEWIETSTEAPIAELKGMNAYQSIGAGITYLRRYNIANFFAISSEEDTDGTPKAASKKDYNQKQSTQQSAQTQKQPQQQTANNNPSWKELGIEFKKLEDGKIIAVETKKGAIYANKELLKKAGFKWDNQSKSWVKSA